MAFICKICDYETNKKGNINRHNKSKKHMANSVPIVLPKHVKKTGENNVMNRDTVRHNAPQCATKDDITCEYCGITFTRSNGLSKHQNNCAKKEVEKQKILLKEKEKQLKEQSVEKEYYKELIGNYSKFGPKTFNSITFVMNKYADAPHIKMIDPEKIECFQNIDMKKVEDMVSDYRNDRFVTFVINTIISLYKKENPEDQVIWSTDSSRYNYLIKELLENEDSYWVVDKKGTKSQNYLVEPILKFIRKEIIKYNELACDALANPNLPKSKFSIILDTQKYSIDIIKDIDDGILGDDIIKKMAKNFYHKNNPLIEEIE